MSRLICLALFAAASCGVLAQAPAASTPAPHKIISPNPPACAAEMADLLTHITDFATGLTNDFVICSEGPRNRFLNPAWRDPRACAQQIISQISFLTDASSSGLALAFDCFNDNQACGQSICDTMTAFLESAVAITTASNWCQNPATHDVGNADIAGFRCWRWTFRAAQRIVKAAKFIDVAVSTCDMQTQSNLPPAPPPPADTNATDTAGLEANASALLGALGPSATAEDNSQDLGASWAALQQPRPFQQSVEKFQVDPVERRLRESFQNVGQLRAQLSGLLAAHETPSAGSIGDMPVAAVVEQLPELLE